MCPLFDDSRPYILTITMISSDLRGLQSDVQQSRACTDKYEKSAGSASRKVVKSELSRCSNSKNITF